MTKFVLPDDDGVTVCECGTEIVCDGNGNMPVACPVCLELLDYTFVDNADENRWNAVDFVQEAMKIHLMEEAPMHVILQQAKNLIADDYQRLSLGRSIQLTKDLRQKAYDLYRLDWMRKNELGLSDLFIAISNYASECEFSDFKSLMQIVNDWELNSGFSGSLWVCYDEFMDTEYLDLDFILTLLPAYLRDRYFADICKLTSYKHAILNGFTVGGRQFMEEVFVDHAVPHDPKVVRFKNHSDGCTAPNVKNWSCATVRQDDGEYYALIEENGKWKIDPTFVDLPF